MSDLVILHPEGQFTVKVATPWYDEDATILHCPEDIPDKVAELCQGFWARRGINFSS
jgi:hypothetical protein